MNLSKMSADVRKQYIDLAETTYAIKNCVLDVIGVTGTNGKTSCSRLLAQAFDLLGEQAAVIGTLGAGFLSACEQTGCTTPDMLTIHRYIRQFADAGAKHVVMEVSSHGLDQGRVEGVPFDTAVFTNLTRDHLDYHGTMEAYAAAKEKLFTSWSLRHGVVNADDAFGRVLIQKYQHRMNMVSYGAGQMISLARAGATAYGYTLDVSVAGTIITVQSQLLGQFNISNLLAVIAVLYAQSVSLADIVNVVGRLSPVPGRLETIMLPHKPLCVVDYAHTPDALQKALVACREFAPGQVYCVFGCGGDRDKGKRPLMAKIAEAYADYSIVTLDNPRTESPSTILSDIQQGFSRCAPVEIIADRKQAIQYALGKAKEGDVVLVAGKGHETYQIIGEERIPFSDVMVAKKYLEEH